jgi:prefoldin subunit 5
MANAPLEAPSTSSVRQINIDQVNAETQELRRLADGLPLQIDQVTKGQMPKDLAENLKRIEKLAKHLRSEITP